MKRAHRPGLSIDHEHAGRFVLPQYGDRIAQIISYELDPVYRSSASVAIAGGEVCLGVRNEMRRSCLKGQSINNPNAAPIAGNRDAAQFHLLVFERIFAL